MPKMKNAGYALALAGVIAFGVYQHRSADDTREAQLSAARAANEQLQLAMAERKCGDQAVLDNLCKRLKQAQIDVDNVIYRINGRHL
ncbi:hypothetical protein [Pandoraea communis]|uniref:hypothetical protein n=1 Tax=Pandoraea communis TaxID=2508297 RepID=UPI0025A623DA|nr:hypothetical protein [Pandoraea communis]MDM8359058.1 hypothetical protein [Pandoraea communis]